MPLAITMPYHYFYDTALFIHILLGMIFNQINLGNDAGPLLQTARLEYGR